MPVKEHKITPSMPAFLSYLIRGLICFVIFCVFIGFFLAAQSHELKLDGQGVVGLLGVALGSAIGLAGALVVVKIADQQNRLAQEQVRLSKLQTDFSAKQTAEYQTRHTQAQVALQGTRQVLMLYALALAAYRQLATNHIALFCRATSPLTPIIKQIEKTLLEPWPMALSRYCQRAGATQALNLNHALALLYEAAHRYVATPVVDETKVEAERKLREFIWLLYVVEYLKNTLFNAKRNYDEKIKSGDLVSAIDKADYELNTHNPTVTAFVHQELAALSPSDFEVSDEVTAEISKHYKAIFGYWHYQPLITNEPIETSSFYTLLTSSFTQAEARTEAVQIIQEAGASTALEHIQEVAKTWASNQGLGYQYVTSPANKDEAIQLLGSIQRYDAIRIIYVAGVGGNPDWLFEYYEHLDRCIVVLDQLPDPSWAANYAITSPPGTTPLSSAEIKANSEAQLARYPEEIGGEPGDDNNKPSEDPNEFNANDADTAADIQAPPMTWATRLRLLAARATDRNSSSRYTRLLSKTAEQSSRTIWIGLELSPDYRDNNSERFKEAQVQAETDIALLIKQAASGKQGLYEAVKLL